MTQPYSELSHRHCFDNKGDSPCGMKGEHRCCLCGKYPMTPEQVKREILDTSVRDICSVSVAPAAKSEVRKILSAALDRMAEVVRTYQQNGEKAVEQSIIDQHVTLAVAEERKRAELFIREAFNLGFGDAKNQALDILLNSIKK